ncbi:uncharacterized protein LOC126780057 [Nymphalis io]|uniref:uncharacterized protein LOC126780057 n=1 Tax=Inachis io TaxID=171585 RepID=UPI00216869C3|nr:uncharacterized protein LOC126780057 [Nymphalis io]
MSMNFFVITLSFVLFVEIAPTFSKIINLDEYPRNNWRVRLESTNNDNIRLEQINKAVDLIIKQEPKANDINECLKHNSLRNHLNCVNYLVKKNKFKRRSHTNIPKHKHYQYNIKKDFNEYDSDEIDLTKSNLNKSFNSRSNFSQDYLDVADLLRTNEITKGTNKTKNRYIFKIVQPKNKYGRFDYDLSRFRKFNPNLKSKKSLRSDSSSDYSASSGSQEDRMRKGSKSHKTFDKSYDIDSSEEVSSEEEILTFQKQKHIKAAPKSKKKIPKLKKPQVLYMQGPSRLYEEDSRRRLSYFFPKRLHWDEYDMKTLRNYWLNGPQGKYSEYRTPY